MTLPSICSKQVKTRTNFFFFLALSNTYIFVTASFWSASERMFDSALAGSGNVDSNNTTLQHSEMSLQSKQNKTQQKKTYNRHFARPLSLKKKLFLFLLHYRAISLFLLRDWTTQVTNGNKRYGHDV